MVHRRYIANYSISKEQGVHYLKVGAMRAIWLYPLELTASLQLVDRDVKRYFLVMALANQ